MNWEIINSNKLDNYGNEIIKMYEDSYKEIGIIDFGGWDNLKNYLNCSCYLLKNDSIINGIILYWLSDYGNKISLVISKDKNVAKNYVIPKLIELIRTPGFYIELSDALEYLLRKEGFENIKDKEIIKTVIDGVKDDDIFSDNDNRFNDYMLNKKNNTPPPSGSYLRILNGLGIHRKALYGLPCLNKNFDGKDCKRKCINGGKNKKSGKNKRTLKFKRLSLKQHFL